MSLNLRWKRLGARSSVRQRRLFSCGCFRLDSDGNPQPPLVALVELAERFADGLVTDADLAPHRHSSPSEGDARLALLSDDDLNQVWVESVVGVRDEADDEPEYAAPAVMARLRVLEDIVGPAGPRFSPEWRTDTAVSLAAHMYESRDFGAMPILADALQDAGCDNDDVLNHCRADAAHVRGCWVVDLVLGKQ